MDGIVEAWWKVNCPQNTLPLSLYKQLAVETGTDGCDWQLSLNCYSDEGIDVEN